MKKYAQSPPDAAEKKSKKATGTPVDASADFAWCLPGQESALELTVEPHEPGESGQAAFRKFLKEQGVKVD